ncbi:MAG: hypothetical protein ACYDEY_08595, partial [Acidimicrobiales bacterium]
MALPPGTRVPETDPHSCRKTRKTELFFGYYGQLATMVSDEGGDEVPEVVRAMIVTTCSSDPVPAFVAVLQRLVSSGVSLGDILADSGY